MTKTPRTDAAETNWWSEDGLRSAFIVRADFARELEREIARITAERDEARKEAESWQDDALRMMRDRNTAEKERDAAREERDELVSISKKLEKERDDARREICSTVVFPSSPKQYAERRGWDCHEEKNP